MRKMRFLTLGLLLAALACAACGAPDPETVAQPSAAAAPGASSLTVEPGEAGGAPLSPEEREDAEICSTIFDWIYGQDTALNEGIELIALDTGGLSGLSAAAKEEFLGAVEAHGFAVREATYGQLCEEGLVDEEAGNYFAKGVLITLSFTREASGRVVFSAEKFRSGSGSIGVSEGVLVKKGGVWTLADHDMTFYVA